MNMNKITYGSRTITDADLAIGGTAASSLMLYQALIGEELKPDTFSFNLIYDKGKLLFLIDADGKYLVDANGKFLVVKADDFDPENFVFGSTLNYYINDGATMVGTFYVQTVRRVDKSVYHFEATSAIGMTTYYGHNGGMYNGATVGSIIADIMGNLPYTIDADLADATVTGHLPKVQAARDNLRALLFMAGGSVKKNPDGTVNFGYIGSGAAKVIQDVSLNVGGSIVTLEPATRVEVTSHEFHALNTDETVTLYDNTGGVAADHLVVDFTDPCHDLVAAGLTVHESGANYAIVTGIGTLTGKKYTHVTSIYAIDTGVKASPNVIQVSDNWLINPGNVANVAKRIKGYYSIAKEVNYTMRVDTERPGDKVTFKDPWGDQQTGYIKNMNVTLSKRLNAAAVIALNWTPGPFGDSYSAYKVFRQSDIVNGRLTFPAEMVGAQALVVLLSGAGGGQAGYDGAQGGHGYAQAGTVYYGSPANGGAGGEAGAPGERGRIYSLYVNALPSYYDNASIGVGGAGGASNGALGSPGGDTTLDTYSTAGGSQLIDDYTNFIDGTSYANLNVAGEAGSAGGIGSGYDSLNLDTSTNGQNHICEDGTVNYGGAYINGKTFYHSHTSYETAGVGGGGAAHGADGNVGQGGDPSTGFWRVVGGAGANAVAPLQAAETQAGRGGHGGGGGGGASASWSKADGQSGSSYDLGTGGAGGLGSAGGQGGDGLIIVYYNA
jgi:hypothetical protein